MTRLHLTYDTSCSILMVLQCNLNCSLIIPQVSKDIQVILVCSISSRNCLPKLDICCLSLRNNSTNSENSNSKKNHGTLNTFSHIRVGLGEALTKSWTIFFHPRYTLRAVMTLRRQRGHCHLLGPGLAPGCECCSLRRCRTASCSNCEHQ